MNAHTAELYRRIEALAGQAEKLAEAAPVLGGLEAMDSMLRAGRPIFAIEPWHALSCGADGGERIGEMLLRLQDRRGDALSPYPLVMGFYGGGLAGPFDALIALAALDQYEQGGEDAVSINISARALRDIDFIKAVLGRVHALHPERRKGVILEIHESSTVGMSSHVLGLFRKAGIRFAMDDVGVSLADVLRLAEFEDVAEFIKLDRSAVCADPGSPQAIGNVLPMARAAFPRARIIAEGIRNADHAREVHGKFPVIDFVQGLFLPDRATFSRSWLALA